ncbi:hypothetical protein LOTGIDRAFT_170319 [Lottia gigantea]|uniref:Lipocalin/cytosolic fatty-acid binding domain-containing protein n=1 Tax=Lottia gigantea TaxID=225164 RepID=V4B1G0_LOTGI|nr:hypothetical protein LOTGIDRAFT_170319 [Lottia gigantea]ESO82044.1 hypothetical protein LOTGIDRAFT_170319 [Lottia gigantea]
MELFKVILPSILFFGLWTTLVSSGSAPCIMSTDFLEEELDKDKFQGKWYMTSWYYHGTGKSDAPLLENVQSLYQLTDDGNWNITYGAGIMENMCFKNPVEAMIDKSSTRMMWIFNFHLHEIVSTDYQTYAVIYQCLDGMTYCVHDSTQIAILSRKPQPSAETQDVVRKAVRNSCVDPDLLIEVSQTKNCLCDDGNQHKPLQPRHVMIQTSQQLKRTYMRQDVRRSVQVFCVRKKMTLFQLKK